MWVYCPADPMASTATTAAIVARILSERRDPKDRKQYNYNYYLVAESSNGGFFQSPPFKTSDLDHHSSGPHSILDSYPPAPPLGGA